MKRWITYLEARDRKTGEIKVYMGDYITAPTRELAQQWCDENKGYLRVGRELVEEQDSKTGEVTYSQTEQLN